MLCCSWQCSLREPLPTANLATGIAALWDPVVILLLEALGLGGFWYAGTKHGDVFDNIVPRRQRQNLEARGAPSIEPHLHPAGLTGGMQILLCAQHGLVG